MQPPVKSPTHQRTCGVSKSISIYYIDDWHDYISTIFFYFCQQRLTPVCVHFDMTVQKQKNLQTYHQFIFPRFDANAYVSFRFFCTKHPRSDQSFSPFSLKKFYPPIQILVDVFHQFRMQVRNVAVIVYKNNFFQYRRRCPVYDRMYGS